MSCRSNSSRRCSERMIDPSNMPSDMDMMSANFAPPQTSVGPPPLSLGSALPVGVPQPPGLASAAAPQGWAPSQGGGKTAEQAQALLSSLSDLEAQKTTDAWWGVHFWPDVWHIENTQCSENASQTLDKDRVHMAPKKTYARRAIGRIVELYR